MPLPQRPIPKTTLGRLHKTLDTPLDEQLRTQMLMDASLKWFED